MNRNYYENLKKIDRTTGRKHYAGQRAKNNARFISESQDLSYELVKYFRDNFSLAEAVDWILGFDMYSQDNRGTYTGKFSSKYTIGRGRIITFDSFGHIGTEQKKNRPAVVLKENSDGVIIAPIGTAAYSSGKPYHVPLEANKKDQGGMSNDCGIKLEQIRYIDKSRIMGTFKKITNVDKLNEIDEKLLEHMSPILFKAYTDLKDDKCKLENRIAELENEVQEKESTIVSLQRTNELLKSQLSLDELPISKDGA